MDLRTVRIVYMGTPDFAIGPLRALARANAHLAGVVTAPDKPAGRGQKIRKSPVKVFTEKELDCPVYQPHNLKDPLFHERLKILEADLFVVVAFRMLPEAVWSIPARGTFNLHASLLPQYRGAAPINHVIMNGENETGVTTFLIDHQIDTGNILLREKRSIGKDETAGELHDRLMEAGSRLVVQTVEGLVSGTIHPKPQSAFEDSSGELKKAPKLQREDRRIDWNEPAASIHNRVRGLSPYPAAFTLLKDPAGTEQELKIYRSHPVSQPHDLLPGTIESDGKTELTVAANPGKIKILELQLAGKKRMKTEDFLRGFQQSDRYLAV